MTDRDEDSITTAQFQALVDEHTDRESPSEPPISPRVDFMYSSEMKKLSESQRRARALVHEMMCMLMPAKQR